MNTKTFLTTFTGAITGAIATSLMTSISPAHALNFISGGGSINQINDTTFTLNVSGVTEPSVVSLNIASLSSDTSGNLGNLNIYLRSPNSDTLLLVQGLSDGSFSNVNFNDFGSNTIDNSTPPYTGTFLPFLSTSDAGTGGANIDSFSSFSPLDNGEWTLLVTTFNDSGTDSIGQITLDITPVPFEFSPMVGVVALGAVWAFKQAQKKK